MDSKQEILQFIQDYQAEHGQAPTLDEIVAAVESLNYRSSAHYRLRQLEEEGLVVCLKPENHGRRYGGKAHTPEGGEGAEMARLH